MDFSAVLPTYLITLREGVEASLVVGIVLAYLKKSRQSHLKSWVYSGIGVGIAVSAIVGVLLSQLVQQLGSSGKYGPVLEPLLEGGFSVIAIVFLSWMLIWMTQNAKGLKASVEGSIQSALNSNQSTIRAGWGVFSLVGVAILREGFETVLFISAKFQQGIFPAIGAAFGIVSAAAIGMMIFKMGIRLNLRKFFLVMGIALLLIVAGLVVTALGHFDTAMQTLAGLDRKSADLCFYYERFAKPMNRSCILGPMVWNLSAIMPDTQFPGIVLSALIGYVQRLYLVQGVSYVLFLGAIGGLYFRSLRPIVPQLSAPANSAQSPSDASSESNSQTVA